MLADRNAHPRDAGITFFEEDHRYEVDGRTFISVTQLISRCFPEFNADEAIRKMGPKHPLYGRPPEEIKALWKRNGEEASALGTEVHRQIEVFLNTGELGDSPEFGCFHQRYVAAGKGVPYRTEWVIYDEELGVAGTIDYVFTVNGHYCMTDWKRSKAIKKENPYQRAFPPIEHLPASNYHKYCLQQNIYRLILLRNYGIDIRKMMLCRLHGQVFEPIKVPMMEAEASRVLELARETAATR